jgi:hypothetical protein
MVYYSKGWELLDNIPYSTHYLTQNVVKWLFLLFLRYVCLLSTISYSEIPISQNISTLFTTRIVNNYCSLGKTDDETKRWLFEERSRKNYARGKPRLIPSKTKVRNWFNYIVCPYYEGILSNCIYCWLTGTKLVSQR